MSCDVNVKCLCVCVCIVAVAGRAVYSHLVHNDNVGPGSVSAERRALRATRCSARARVHIIATNAHTASKLGCELVCAVI